MAKMKFRFTTECELTLSGSSYEEVYLKFKDLLHEENVNAAISDLHVFPPEDSNVYFEIEGQQEYNRIDGIKGDFKQDILQNCPASVASTLSSSHQTDTVSD